MKQTWVEELSNFCECNHEIGHNAIEHEGISHATGEQLCLLCKKTLKQIMLDQRHSLIEEIIEKVFPESNPWDKLIEYNEYRKETIKRLREL